MSETKTEEFIVVPVAHAFECQVFAMNLQFGEDTNVKEQSADAVWRIGKRLDDLEAFIKYMELVPQCNEYLKGIRKGERGAA